MTKKDIAEIKRRLKIDRTTITHLSGCYVNEKKEIVTTFSEQFLNLDDEEIHKYLEIASKALSGTYGNNLLELSFADDSEEMSQSLLAIKQSKLQDESVLDSFYNHVIDTYDTVDHFLILLFYDAYDIPLKTTDNMLLDESDEIYEYIIACICPVSLSKPGLSYRSDQNRIAPRIRDWIVGPCESAFTYPCFSDRTTDIHHILVYTKNARQPHSEFWEEGLGAGIRFTSTQKRVGLLELVARAAGEDQEETPELLLDVQQNIYDYEKQQEPETDEQKSVVLSKQDLSELLEDSGLNERHANRIVDSYEELFPDESIIADELYESRALKDNTLRKEKKILQEKVASMSKDLLELGLVDEDGMIIDIAVHTRPERGDSIETAYIDGRKCIVIPLEDDDTATVNGQEISL